LNARGLSIPALKGEAFRPLNPLFVDWGVYSTVLLKRVVLRSENEESSNSIHYYIIAT
jgi:hypothetical protein